MIQMDLKAEAANADAEGLSETIESYETTSTCESYDTKYAEVDWTSNSTANDPCFGYTTSCCEDTDVTGGCCYWKQTSYCLNSYGRSDCDENDGEGCPACCDSTDTASEEAECTPTEEPTKDPTMNPVTPAPVTPAPVDTPAPTVEVTTPAPTMHSAKKWAMLHPDYQGGDGELLWSIYYGEYAVDQRFDAFRDAQMWDADVIRPMIVDDVEFARFQTVSKSSSSSNVGSHQWMILAAAAMVIVAAFAMWLKQRSSYQKIVDPVETKALLESYGN